jgi:tetratricopeptide (TPR) repeat protein
MVQDTLQADGNNRGRRCRPRPAHHTLETGPFFSGSRLMNALVYGRVPLGRPFRPLGHFQPPRRGRFMRLPGLLMILLMVFSEPGLPLAAGEKKGPMSLAAGMAVNKAQSLMAEDKPDQALAVLIRYSEKQAEPVHFYIDFLAGICHTELGQTREAAAAFQRAVDKKPDLSPAWLNLARCRYEQGQMAGAARAFENGYETSDKKQAVHLFYAASCLFQAGRADPALTVFNRLVAAHPEEISLEWKQTLVHILFDLKKFKEALPWLEELAEKTQGDGRRQWQEMLLYQYLSLEMKQKALACARHLTRTHPEDPGWWKALAHVHLAENRFEQALAAMLSYSYLTSLTREESLLLADLYLSCNIPESAARQYEEWLAQHGDTLSEKQLIDKITTISRAWLAAGNPEQALAWAHKGLEKASDPDLSGIKAYVLAIEIPPASSKIAD